MHSIREILESARQWIDTPYQHQGRLLGVGVDCLGLVIGVAKDLDLCDPELLNYGDYARVPDGNFLKSEIEKFCEVVELPPEGETLPPGMLALFKFREDPQHCGITNDTGGIIHAHQGADKVCEHTLDSRWRRRVVGIYKFPGVSYG